MHMQVIEKKLTNYLKKFYNYIIEYFTQTKKKKSKRVCKGGLTAHQGLLDFKQ